MVDTFTNKRTVQKVLALRCSSKQIIRIADDAEITASTNAYVCVGDL